MPGRPAILRARGLQMVVGLFVGIQAAAVAGGVVGLTRGETVGPVESTYRLSDDDALGSGTVSLINVSNIRQSTSIPGLTAPTRSRYVSLALAMERRDATAQQ